MVSHESCKFSITERVELDRENENWVHMIFRVQLLPKSINKNIKYREFYANNSMSIKVRHLPQQNSARKHISPGLYPTETGTSSILESK